jgi:chromatin remodeling complex protein RSC6
MAPTKVSSPKAAAVDVKKASTKAKTAAAVTEVAPTPVVECCPPVAVVVEDPPVTEETQCSLTVKLNALVQNLTSVQNVIKEAQVTVKALTKEVNALLKQKSRSSQKKNRAPRAPSGFAKQTIVSDEMYDFLGVERGTMISRTDVTRKINEYIKSKNLQDPQDKRIILPDASLQKILASTPEDKLTYFNLQTFLSKHFNKAT